MMKAYKNPTVPFILSPYRKRLIANGLPLDLQGFVFHGGMAIFQNDEGMPVRAVADACFFGNIKIHYLINHEFCFVSMLWLRD